MSVDADRLSEALDGFGERTSLMVVRNLAAQAPGISGGLLARALCRSSWQIGLELGLRIGVMDRIGAEELLEGLRRDLAGDDPHFDTDGRATAVAFLTEVIR